MTNEITRAAALPSLAAGNVNRLLASFQIDVYGFGDVALDRFPNAEERRILQDRNRDLFCACSTRKIHRLPRSHDRRLR